MKPSLRCPIGWGSIRTGASRVALACDVTPSNHSFGSTTICAPIGIVRQKMLRRENSTLVRAP